VLRRAKFQKPMPRREARTKRLLMRSLEMREHRIQVGRDHSSPTVAAARTPHASPARLVSSTPRTVPLNAFLVAYQSRAARPSTGATNVARLRTARLARASPSL